MCDKEFLGHFVSDFPFSKEAGGHRWSANIDLFEPAIQSLHQVGQNHLLFMGPSQLMCLNQQFLHLPPMPFKTCMTLFCGTEMVEFSKLWEFKNV